MKHVEALHLGKDWGGEPVFGTLSFSVNPGDKIGLIGRNGCGKTTLLEIIAGLDQDFSGSLNVHDECRVAYVPQYLQDDQGITADSFLMRDVADLRRRLSNLEEAMGNAEGAELDAVLREYQETREVYDGMAGDTAEARAERLLDGAGLSGKDATKLEELSGGERNILSLLRAVVSMPDLLILDEPGNHLDYAGLAWLEGFLKDRKCAVILVSHNRYLLDRVIDRVWELEGGGLVQYRGNYSAYRLEKLKAAGAAGKQFKADQKKIKRLEELVRRFEEAARNTADPAWGRRLRARRTQLEKMREEARDKPVVDTPAADLAFRGDTSRADIAVDVSAYSKSFGDLCLFHQADLFIRNGERVALTGPNGCGKSTFLKDLVSRGHWDDPVLKIGPSMVVGYCAQHQEVFDKGNTIVAEFEKLVPATRDEVFSFLSRFGFTWEDLARPVGTLSGGEKNRLQLARAIYLKANFLVLDEPTNHLDIPTREAIEEGLEDFAGTILVVSHDRYFLDKIAGRVVEVADRRFVDYRGNFSEYWALRRAMNQRGNMEIERRAADLRRHNGDRGRSDGDRGTENRQNGGDRGRLSGDRGRPGGDRGRQEDLETRITRLEARQRELEGRINASYREGDYNTGSRLSGELEKIVGMLDRAYDEWGTL